MTNSSKKQAIASRDNLDLDLEARLTQATSTLPLDDEPPMGDALDQILARAKKEIDADSPETLTAVEVPELRTKDEFELADLPNDDIVESKTGDDFRPIKSDTMTSMERQLTETMNATLNSPEEDEELDRLLGGSGFDFDSLFGEAVSDEIVAEMPEMNEDSVMAEVDELLTFSAKEDEDVAVEPEIKVEALDEIVEPEENELDSSDELTVEPEAALDDLVAEIENFAEDFNNVDEVADSVAPLVEISTSDESLDDFNEMQLDELTEIVENKNDTLAAGFDLLDDDNLEKNSAMSVDEPETEDDWMKQLEGLDEENTEPTAEEKTIVEDVADDDWMKQLEGLEEENTEPTAEEKTIVEDITEDDWMKQLEGLDEENTESTAEEKTIVEDVADDDWMKQLEGLDEQDEDAAKMRIDDTNEVAGSDFNIANESDEKSETPVIDEDALIAKAADLATSQFKDEQNQALSQLRADQDALDSKNKKQFADAENKRKKSAMFSYIALGVGIIGLLGSAGIGWLSYGMKDKTETLTQSVTVLEEKVDGFLAKNPEKEIENLKTSVEQLNQKVEKLTAAQVVVSPAEQPIVENGKVSTSEAVKKSAPVTLLNNKVAPISPKVTTDSTSIPAVSIAPENLAGEKENEPTKLKEMAKKSASAEAELLSQKIAKANAVAKAASAAKPTDKTEKTNYYTGRTTRGMARTGTEDRSKSTKPEAAEPSSVTTASKEILNTTITPKKAVSAGKYRVNVISYQQEWFAQSKAAEFKQKGIPVEVIPADANDHATKYRLAVSGFKNKAEANAYAEKIKKQHNLNETWIGENQ